MFELLLQLLSRLFNSFSRIDSTLTLIDRMVGALNKLPVAASGMLFFGDAVTFPSVSAIFTGFVAGLVYAAAKSAQSAKSGKLV